MKFEKTRSLLLFFFAFGGALLLTILALNPAQTVLGAWHNNAQAGLISGFVTDPDGGLPPAGSKVFLITADDEVFGQAMVNEADGSFSLGPVGNGGYLIQARPPADSAFTPSIPKHIIMHNGSVDAGILALTNPSITGTVFAPDGVTPITATVKIYRQGQFANASLAENGVIAIGGIYTGVVALQANPVTNDPYWLSAATIITVTASSTHTVDLVLTDANVAGIVTDPENNPIPYAKVVVWGAASSTYRHDFTNGSGYFSIGNLPDDDYILQASPPLAATGLAESAPKPFSVPPEFTDMGTIKLRAAPKLLSGVVKTNSGDLVHNARVHAYRLDLPGHDSTLTLPNGSYGMNLGPGLWAVSVQKTDFTMPAHWIYPDPPKLVHYQHNLLPESKHLNFQVITADSEVSGQIEMPGGGTPPFTVTVQLRNNEGVGLTQLMADDGSFSFRVPHGNYVLYVQPQDSGYAGPPPQHVHAPRNSVANVGTLTLIAKDALISGVVADEDGAGVGGVNVAAWMGHDAGSRTVTNPDGSYSMAVIPGIWQVRPNPAAELAFIYSGDPISVTLATMETITDVNFTLTTANNVVVGLLVDEAGAVAAADGWATASAEDGVVNGAPIESGAFTIYLPDGDYVVKAHLAPGSEWIPGKAQDVSLAGGEVVTVSLPMLPKDAGIAGALWDPRAKIVPTGIDGIVLAHNPQANAGTAINPANGTYELPLSAGLWHIGYGVDPQSGYVALDHHKVVGLQSGQTMPLPLPVTKRDSIIQGTVLNPDGDPLAGAVVTANGIDGAIGQVVLRTHSNDAGEFSLRVPYGAYHLWAGYDNDSWLNPANKIVVAPENDSSHPITLQFQEPDVVLSGTTSIAARSDISGTVHIWAYSNAGTAAHTAVPLGETYTLNLLSNNTWHIGAVLETRNSFYGVRTSIDMGSGDETLDLVLDGPHSKPGPVSVTFDAGIEQRFELADGTHIYIPAGAMPATGLVTIHATPLATFPHQRHARLYAYGYAFVAFDESGQQITENFNENVIISFAYDEEMLANQGLNENHLKPAYYATSTKSWTIPESYVVNVEENRVIMQIDHFTDFSLLNEGQLNTVFLPIMSNGQ